MRDVAKNNNLYNLLIYQSSVKRDSVIKEQAKSVCFLGFLFWISLFSMESQDQKESELKLLQAKVAFLETQVAALRRSSVETESEVPYEYACKLLVPEEKRKNKTEGKVQILVFS